jgi:hypothetical protein
MHPDSPTVLDVPKPTLYKHPYKGKKHKKKPNGLGKIQKIGLLIDIDRVQVK